MHSITRNQKNSMNEVTILLQTIEFFTRVCDENNKVSMWKKSYTHPHDKRDTCTLIHTHTKIALKINLVFNLNKTKKKSKKSKLYLNFIL